MKRRLLMQRQTDITILTAVRAMAQRWREHVLSTKDDTSKNALTDSGINGAWRGYVQDHPELAPYKDEFVRVARGEE